MKNFIKDLEKRGGRVLDKIVTYDGKTLLYYREENDLVTQTRTKRF